MASELTTSRLLGFKDFFPNENNCQKKELAQLLGRELLFKFISHFLSFFRVNKVPSNEKLFQEWFTFIEFEYSQSPSYHLVVEQYNRILNFHPRERFSFLCIESLLKLFMWLSKQTDIPEATDHKDASFALHLFKLYLLFNDDVLENFAVANGSVEGYDSDRKIQLLILSVSFPQHDFVNIDYAQLFFTQFYKAIKLLNFLSNQPAYSNIYSQFLKEFNCQNKNEYFNSIQKAVIQSLNNLKATWTTLAVVKDQDFEKNCNFLETISVEQYDELIYEQNDYLSLRSKPFHKIGIGQYRVVFDAFLIKKVYNGLVFKLSEIDKKNKEAVKSGIETEFLFNKDFLGTLRNEFSEGVLVYETLEKIFPEINIRKITGKEFESIGLKRAPDYYIRKKNSVLLFESKDFFIPGKVKLSYDFRKIEAEFKKEGRFEKAVLQLKENIKRVFKKNLILDKDYLVDEIKIYPIIIVHDSLFSAPALNYWIYYWLFDELQKLKKEEDFKNFNFNQVMPLTIIEIDTLILYERHFIEGSIDLIDVIQQYQSHTKFGFNGPYYPAEEVILHALRSALSFSEFARDFAFKHNIELKFMELDKLLNEIGIK